MVSEAASTGKPVHVVHLQGRSAKFTRFHEALVEAGIARPFTGTLEAWSYAPLDETRRIAGEIRRRLLERRRSEEHTSELQSLMRISYAVFCLKKKNKYHNTNKINSKNKDISLSRLSRTSTTFT